jgi:hypothetical protein
VPLRESVVVSRRVFACWWVERRVARVLAAYQFKYCKNEMLTEGKEEGDSHDDDFHPKFPGATITMFVMQRSAARELNHLPALDAASFALVSFINPRVDLQKFYEAE